MDAGQRHAVIVGTDGRLYGLGSNRHGQLGPMQQHIVPQQR
jgi:alpha-tubulin suppressor-like RCC1 family protein